MNKVSKKNPAKMVAVVFATALLLVGCGKEQETPVIEETVSENSVRSGGALKDGDVLPEDFAGLTREQLDAVPELETVTQEQLYNMSIDEFRALIYTYCPNFREVYGISSEMTEDKWNSFRMVVSYQLYGKITYTPTYEEQDDETVARDYVKSMLETLGNLNILYSYFDGLESDDCAELASLFENATDEEIVYCLEQLSEEDYSSLTDEQIAEFRDVFVTEFTIASNIKNILEEYPSINIDSVISELEKNISGNDID